MDPSINVIVPAVIIAAIRNAGYPVPEGAIEKALERASKVPGGWCGLYTAIAEPPWGLELQ